VAHFVVIYLWQAVLGSGELFPFLFFFLFFLPSILFTFVVFIFKLIISSEMADFVFELSFFLFYF